MRGPTDGGDDRSVDGDDRAAATDTDGAADRTATGSDDAGPIAVLRDVVERFREEDVPFRAASVAFYALSSFVPLLLVFLSVLSVLEAEDALIDVLRSGLSEGVVDVVDEAIRTTAGRGGAGVVGFLVALWSGTKVFRALSLAFAKCYDRADDVSLVEEATQGLVVLGVLVLAIVAASVTSVLVAVVPVDVPFASLAWNLLGLLALVLVLLPMYYVLPPGSVTVRHALPGAVVTAVGWVLLQNGFSIYARNAGEYAAYGFLGAVVLFTIFLYVAAIVLLLGAIVNVSVERTTEQA